MQTKTHEKELTPLMKVAPWAAGAGIAIGHILTSSNCTIPKQGLCSTCGSCVIALGSLVAWAMIKKRQGNDFYSEEAPR
jgi:hypothetical protein